MSRPESRICASCGRRMTWRRRWAADWDEVRYCSRACRRRCVDATDRALERSILELLARRSRRATICPSEAAREVDPDGWRGLMEPARRAARRLAAADRLRITQRGRPVDPSIARGAIRLGLPGS